MPEAMEILAQVFLAGASFIEVMIVLAAHMLGKAFEPALEAMIHLAIVIVIVVVAGVILFGCIFGLFVAVVLADRAAA